MTLNAAMKILEKDAEWCGLEFNKYLGLIGQSRGAFPQRVLTAFEVYRDHIVREREMER